MAVNSNTNSKILPAITCFSNSALSKSINSFRPFSSSSSKIHPFASLPRLRICQRKIESLSPKQSHKLLVAFAGLVDGNSEINPEADSNEGSTIDIKLPRRSLLVKFTCDDCGERSQRLINRLAYEKGLVFIQCAGCEKYHKLVDNLGLVIEYDLREEISSESNTDEA